MTKITKSAKGGMADKNGPNLGNYASYGFEVAAGVGLGVAIGWWLDKRHHWTPWGTIIGAAIGLVAGMYSMIRDALRANKD